MVIGMANLAMATGNIGRPGVGVNPLRGQNNVQGSCDMGSFPHELSGYRHVADGATRALFEAAWRHPIHPEPGLRIPNMFDAAMDGSFKGDLVQGEDLAQSDPNTVHVTTALAAMELVVVQDLFLNETANYAHVFLPGHLVPREGRHVHQRRAPHQPRAPCHAPALRQAGVGGRLRARHRHGRTRCTTARPARSWTRSPRSRRRSPACRSASSTSMAACNGRATTPRPSARPVMHVERFVRGLGRFVETPFVPTEERATRRFPLILTTGRILSQYNVGAQTRRTPNIALVRPRTCWRSTRMTREERGIEDGDLVSVASRVGATRLRAEVSERVPQGVVYTTFHYPVTGANVVTTEFSDWATNCPEYKVTAVQVALATGRHSNGEGVGFEVLAPRDHLVQMANQIAAQFRHHPEEEAVARLANHLHQFWEPRMISGLVAQLGASEADPLVAAALGRLREQALADPVA